VLNGAIPANLSVVQGMQCDLDTPNGATSFTYTGYGILYNGTPLVPEVSGCTSREQCLAPWPSCPLRVASPIVAGHCRALAAC
jgi:hypothetical protein